MHPMVVSGTMKDQTLADGTMMTTSKLPETAALVEVALLVQVALVVELALEVEVALVVEVILPLMQYARTLPDSIHLVMIAHFTLLILASVVFLIMSTLQLQLIVVLVDNLKLFLRQSDLKAI